MTPAAQGRGAPAQPRRAAGGLLRQLLSRHRPRRVPAAGRAPRRAGGRGSGRVLPGARGGRGSLPGDPARRRQHPLHHPAGAGGHGPSSTARRQRSVRQRLTRATQRSVTSLRPASSGWRSHSSSTRASVSSRCCRGSWIASELRERAKSRRRPRSTSWVCGKRRSSTSAKCSRSVSLGGPVARPLDRRRPEDLAQLGRPGQRGVEGVAEQPQDPRRPQHPPDLRQRRALVEPVEGGARRRPRPRCRPAAAAARRARRGSRICGSVARRTSRISASGSTATTLCPAASTAALSLPVPGSEVEHRQRSLAEHPLDRGTGIGGAAALVLLRRPSRTSARGARARAASDQSRRARPHRRR